MSRNKIFTSFAASLSNIPQVDAGKQLNRGYILLALTRNITGYGFRRKPLKRAHKGFFGVNSSKQTVNKKTFWPSKKTRNQCLKTGWFTACLLPFLISVFFTHSKMGQMLRIKSVRL